jgi:hypothetical protein
MPNLLMIVLQWVNRGLTGRFCEFHGLLKQEIRVQADVTKSVGLPRIEQRRNRTVSLGRTESNAGQIKDKEALPGREKGQREERISCQRLC